MADSKLRSIVISLSALTVVSCAVAPEPISVNELSDPDALELRAHEFWESRNVPRPGKESPRVVIVEFSLEYLSESPTLPPGFDANLRLELPEMLYELFEETIVEFGREPIALRKVSQAKAYQRLRGSSFRDSSSKESTAANEAVFHAAPGLLVLDENQAWHRSTEWRARFFVGWCDSEPNGAGKPWTPLSDQIRVARHEVGACALHAGESGVC